MKTRIKCAIFSFSGSIEVKWKVNLMGVIPTKKENAKVKYISTLDDQGRRKEKKKDPKKQ
jgi:hypothetical protein